MNTNTNSSISLTQSSFFYLTAQISSFADYVPLETSLGGLSYDESTYPPTLVSAKAISLVYTMSNLNTTDPERPDATDAVLELEEELQQEFYWRWNKAGSNRLLETAMITDRSVNDEIQRLVSGDIFDAIVE